MARTYNQIKQSVLGKKYDINSNVERKSAKKSRTYEEIKSDVMNGKADFSLVKSQLENTIRFDTLNNDLSSMGKTIGDIHTNWQTQDTMNNTRSSVESMQKRLSALKEYQMLFGDKNNKSGIKNIEDIQYGFRQSLNNWEDLSKQYGKYMNADAYKNETTKLRELYSMSAKDIKPYLNDKKNGVAYTTSEGQNIKWKDLYDVAALKEFEDGVKNTVDIAKHGEFKKKNVKYSYYGVGANTGVYIDDEDAFLYNYVNGDKDARDNGILVDLEYQNTWEGLKNKHFTENEIRTFNALWETQGPEKAKEYAELLSPELQQRRIEYENQLTAEAAKEAPFITSTISVIENLGNNMKALPYMAVDYFEDNEIDPNSALYTGRRHVQTTRSTVENDVIDSGVGKFVYRHGMNAADNLAARTMNAGIPYASQVIMSSGAATDTVLDAKERGLSDEQALGLGTVSFAAEWFFESKGVEAFFNKGNLTRSGWKYFVNNLSTELKGELATELTTDAADFFIAQDLNKLNTEFKSYKARGMSDKEAFSKVASGVASRYLDVAAGTLFSTGIQTGPTAAIGSYNQNSLNKSIGQNIKANNRVSDVFELAFNPEVESAYQLYTKLANKGVTTENISDVQLGRLYTNAKLDAQETMQNKKASSEQKQSAISTLSKLGDIETEVAVKKAAKKLNVGEETKVTESGETVDIKNLKVKGDEVTFATNEGEVSVDDVTLTQRDAELVVLAKGISKTDGEDIANVFINQYDGNTDTYEYSTSFNLAMTYAKNNFPQEFILENKGVLSAPQVNAIYQATVIKEANARETELENLANEQGKNMTIQGVFDDSIIDYNNSTTDGSKVNWRSLSSTQRAAIKFTKLFSKATGVNIKFIKSNVKDGKHQGKNGSYNPSTNTIEIDVYAGRIDATNLNDAIIPTLSHELTHWMKAKSPAIYNSIKEDIIKTLKEGTGLSSDTIIAKELNRLKKAHPDKKHTVDEAVEELVARACEDMLSNSNAARKLLSKMSETEQQSFIEKVKETFENLIQWINDLLAHYKSTSEEAKILREYKDMLKKVSKQWDEMLIKSVKVNQALEKSGAYGRKSNAEGNLKYLERPFAEQVDEVLSGTFDRTTDVYVGKLPKILQEVGLNGDLPMLTSANHIRKANKPKNTKKHQHGLTDGQIKSIPDKIATPVMIMDSLDGAKNSVVIVTDMLDVDKSPVVVSIKADGYGRYNSVEVDSNFLTGYYGRDGFTNFITNNVAEDTFLYINKEKATILETESSTSWLEQLKNYDFNVIIRKTSANVKEKNSDRDSTGRELSKGQIEYFKNSTVRDDNGSLKVMYRGDSSEFTVFDKKKTKHSNLYGRGFYFTDSKAHAEQYGGSREFYLDIKNPLSPKQNAITKKQMLNFLKAIENDGEDYDLYNYGQDATAESVLNSVWGKGDFEMLQDINAGAIGDLVAAVELFNEVNGTNYDGIILPTETVTFNSEQAKLTSNLNPTEDKDIRFSMRENVEETREFVAVHNLSAEKLLKALKLGGLPMPSIAITRAREGWNNFGDISLVFNKDTIDPKFFRSNKVYSGDAWTPTYPRIAYKLNTKAQEKIREKINGLVPRNVQSDLGGLHLDSSNMEDELNRHGDMVKSYRYNYAMKYAFLKDNNVNIELPTMDEPLYRYGEVSNSAVISFAHKMVDGLKTVNSLLEQHSSKLMDDMELINGIATVLNEEVISTVEENTDAYQKLVESPVFKPEDIDLSTVLGMLEAARKYFNSNGKVESKIDYKEARNLIDEKTDMAKYESWLKDLFSDIVAKEGIRNNKDLYTPSGNRRSFEALHYEHNLENVIKAMKEEGTKGIGGFGGGNIFGASTKEYSSIDELKADAENRMQLLPESKYEEIKKGFSDRLFELANSLPIHKDSFSAIDDAANMLIEAISKFKTKSGMANYLRTESKGWANYSDYIVDDLIEIVNEIRNMPVSYFEAKPQRAVGYDEIKAVIMPAQYSYEDDISEVKAELEKLNIPILEYEYGDNNARIKALNSLEEVRFSDRDTEYLELAKDPVKNESRLREMVYEAAKEKGYTDDSSWRMQHSAPNSKEDVSLDKLKESGLVPDDYWEHPEWYTYSPEERESYYKVKKALEMQERRKSEGNPRAAHMWVYRAVDKTKNKREDYFRNGDWVTPSYEYAVNEGKMNPNGYRIIKHSVSIKDLYWDGNSIAELGYDDGSNYAYADTLNNRKLLDLVTYDYDGNIIPLSKRFNRREYDVRYSDREETSVYDLMGETERVKKENEKFKAEIERLKERLKLERTVTNGNYFNENQLGAVAGHLRNISKSLIAKDKLVDSLRDVYSFIAHSPELTWEEVFERCYRIADSMIAEAKPEKMADDYSKHILREIKSKRISLSEAQKKEAQHIFGKNWNRNFFGSVVITDGGISIEDQWQEWATMYPGIFDADITDTDMPGELYDIIGSLRDASETVMEYNTEEQTRWLAREIYNQYWNVSPIRTTADKYDKQIKLLNFEHRRIMTEFREDYNTRLKEQRKTDREKYQKLAKEIRERKDKQIAQAKEHGREMIDKYKDNAERKTRIQRITANALTLNKWLTKNSKDYHIHEAMKGPVVKLLNAIDFSSKRMLEKGEATQKDTSFAEAFAEVNSMLKDADNMVEGLESLYGHDLAADIEKLAKSTYNLVGDNNYIINAMSLEELQSLDKIVRHIKKVVTDLNKFHVINHNQGAINLANEFMEHGEKLGNLKKQHGKYAKFFEFRNRTPYYFFKDLGKAGEKLFNAFQDGWDKLAFNAKKVIDFAKETYTAKEVKEWSKETKEFTLTQFDGSKRTFEMSIAQIMALHCVSKQKDAQNHLLSGGMTLKRIDKKGHVVTDYDNITLTLSDLQTILSSLTDRQKEVADKLQNFMNTVCSAWGNEISMARFGIEMFGIPDYFPIKVSEANVPTDNTKDIDNASLFRLLNMSFTKARNQKAEQSIEIGDIFDIFAQHSSDMAKYNALALPVLDFNKFYSIHGTDLANKESGVVRTLKSVFGDEANGYIRRFVRDLNGSQNVSRDVIGSTFFKNAKVASVAANLRVVLLQPTAFFKASAVMDNKYLLKASAYVKVEPVGMVKKLKKAIADAEKYCGIVQWKSLGYYDTDISKGLTEKIKHADGFKDKAIEKSLKLAEIADKVTFGTLWIASEFEIRDTRKDLKVGSEEFYNAIANRLRDVIYATQVVDSTMTRSDMMRSPDKWDKMLTAFGSEPIIAYNMLLDMVTQYNRDKKEFGNKEARKMNSQKIRKVVTAYVITNAVAALVESGFDALRDDDDEEMDAAEFMKLYLKNFAFDMSVGNKLPYVKEAYSLLQGYSSSRMDTQWLQSINYVIKDIKKLTEGEGSWMKTTKDVTKAMSYLSGLPFFNVYRDAMALLEKLGILDEE